MAERFGRKRTNVVLVLLVVPLHASKGPWTDLTAHFVSGLVMCSLVLAPFGAGHLGQG